MNEQAQVYACAAPKAPAPREVHRSLLVGDFARLHSNGPMGSNLGGGAWSRPAGYSAPPQPPGARLPCVEPLCCDHVGYPGRAACFGFPSACRA